MKLPKMEFEDWVNVLCLVIIVYGVITLLTT